MSERRNESLFVVGIAASAGGVSAMVDLLANASCHKSMCFVVVSHVQRFKKSEIPSILARASNLRSVEIEDGVRLEHCGVYVIPPNRYVEVEDGQLRVRPRPEKVPNNCADHFFKSLAENYGSNSIGVVLSGSAVGADGTKGLLAIKKVGGHTYAQSPETAEFPSMPELAIESGAVDFILTPEQIGHELSLVNWAL